MKRHLNLAMIVLFLALWNGGSCLAGEFDASLYVAGDDRDVTIKVNGVRLSMVKGGATELVQLFLADDPKIKTLPREMSPKMRQERKELFCLRKGENTIEIAFKERGKPEYPSLFTVEIRSVNYRVPVLKYVKNPDIKQGNARGAFTIDTDEPAGFKSIVLQ